MTSVINRSAFVPPLALSNDGSSSCSLDFASNLIQSIPAAVNIEEEVTTVKSLKMKLGVSRPSKEPRSKPWVVGHRGALYDELENTLPSFQRCADLGCEAVELDVFLLKDGTLIAFHGGGTDQNPGLLSDYCLNQDGRSILDCETFSETQNLAFNPFLEEFGCSKESVLDGRIPALEEVLRQARMTGIVLKIELKGEGCTLPVLKLVDKMDMADQCHFSCFDHSRIALVRELHPERNPDGSFKYKTGALFDEVPADFIERAQALGASEIHLKYDTCTKERIGDIHKAGMGSMAWFRGPIGMREDTEQKYLDVGNEDFNMYQTLMDTGVQQLCCNKPDVLLNYLTTKA